MTNPNVRPDLEALKVPSESFSDDDMLLRRLWKWEAEMSRSARELAAVPDLKDAAHGTSEVARALRDAAVRIAASNTSTPGPDLIAHIERLQSDLRAIDRIVEDNITETDGPHRARWKGEWIEGPAAEMIHSLLRGMQKIARATLSQGKTHE
jgi:hypothetical protein